MAAAPQTSIELRAWLQLTRRLPPLPRALGLVERVARPLYNRRDRALTIAAVLGATMELDPTQGVDGPLLFALHLVDRRERRFLAAGLRPGAVFVDLGAHIGFYSLWAARQVGALGTVLAAEAAPTTFERLQRNLALNPSLSVRAHHVGVSDRTERLHLGFAKAKDYGGNSFLKADAQGVAVDCVSLVELLHAEQITTIDAMKLDLEGFEFRVLAGMFAHAPRSLWPRRLVVEHHAGLVERAGGDALDLLRTRGYALRQVSRHNWTGLLC